MKWFLDKNSYIIYYNNFIKIYYSLANNYKVLKKVKFWNKYKK